jgi:hypothetical protein
VIQPRDSAGIEIIEHKAGFQRVTRWSVESEPLVDIGSRSDRPGQELFRVRSVAWLSTGDIVVANAGTQEIRVFDGAGFHARSLGRKGSGPGEFQQLGWVQVTPGDSLFAYDLQLQRITVFTPQGSVVRSIPVNVPGVRFPLARGRLGDGSILVMEEAVITTGSRPGIHRDSTTFHRISSTGEPLGVLGRFPGGETFVQVSQTGSRTAPVGFGRTLELAAQDSGMHVGTTDAYEIRTFTSAGKLVRILRVEAKALPVTGEMVAAYKVRHLSGIPEPEWRRFFREMDEAMTYPETLPFHGPMKVDRELNLWVQTYAAHPDSSADWHVFAPDGRQRASVRMPLDFVVHEVGIDQVLGVWRDENEVERVRVHRLRRVVQ